MHLKNIEVQGFKSFADKIHLEFDRGITSVVGPNGSGKSNIADAIRWVLGEQSAKTLRGGKMEDVIFAGTEFRKPTGFSEVSLTIDNSDGLLSIDFNEITVTRRVYRSGESEYLINKTPCRLKDIHELFMDTGVGKDGYSIIGQGRVDEILSNKSEERRLIFEEASGIMKYKTRKLDAEKKLDATHQNLLRINDIINEMESRIEPLKSQSDIAKKYLDLRDKLKEIEISLYVENILNFKEKIKDIEINYVQTDDNIKIEEKKLIDINNENQLLLSEIKTHDKEIENFRLENSVLKADIEKCNLEIKVNEEKINNFTLSISSTDTDVAEFTQKMDMLFQERAKKEEKIEYYNQKSQEFHQKLHEAEEKYQTLLETINETEKQVELLRVSMLEKMDFQSDKKAELINIKAGVESFEKNHEILKTRNDAILLEKDKEMMRKEDLKDSLDEFSSNIISLRNIINSKKEQQLQCMNNLEKQTGEYNVLKNQIEVKSSKKRMLEDMEKNLEGYGKSIKMILKECEISKSFGTGIHGAFAQLIKVSSEYECAIETVLGGVLQNIVTDDEASAKRAIEYLKQNKIGRATFLPISAVKGKYIEKDILTQTQAMDGFLGVASDLVECDAKYKNIVLSFLGRVVVVNNLDTGIKMAKRFGYSFKIVTIEGDILNPGGSMSGGSIEKKSSGILGRNRDILLLQQEIDESRSKIIQIESHINSMKQNIELNNKDIQTDESKLKDLEMSNIRTEGLFNQACENIKKYEAQVLLFESEKVEIKNQIEEFKKEMEKHEMELDAIEKEVIEIKEIIAKNQEENKDIQNAKEVLYDDITNYKISVNSFIESIQNINDAILAIDTEKENLLKTIDRKNKDKENKTLEIHNLTKKNQEYSEKLKMLEGKESESQQKIINSEEQRRKMEESSQDIIKEITQINKNILLLKEEFNRIEVRKVKIESEIEQIQNRMWEEYELTYSKAVELKKDIQSVSNAQKQINLYKAEIKDLGNVNVNAIEEYINLKERYEFMSSQRDDMAEAIDKLKNVISEMTSIMKKQFITQFKLINENFGIVFKELFGGGKAELVLADENNVLESGIDIVVQPPGKKLQNMMLLSGGEKAFTAISLLFAILKLRPAPFCILDEIEAALDDANVYKFAEYLKKHTHLTQFILITHRKGTMEASDTLYGVTMQEHGISRIISMKLGEKEIAS